MYKIIGSDQKEYGPIDNDQMRQWITEGRVNGQTPIQAEGETTWKPLSTVPEFAAILPASAPPPPPSGLAPAPAAGSVPNYLVQAIILTLCCCLPFGIVAIVYAAQVNGKLQAGDFAGAQAASKNAKMWCWLAFGVGIFTNALVLALQFMAGAFGGMR